VKSVTQLKSVTVLLKFIIEVVKFISIGSAENEIELVQIWLFLLKKIIKKNKIKKL
jgi:hypothetical protein